MRLEDQIWKAVYDAYTDSGLSQYKLAKLIHISSGHLNQVLTRKRRLTPELADLILKVLNKRIVLEVSNSS